MKRVDDQLKEYGKNSFSQSFLTVESDTCLPRRSRFENHTERTIV